MDKIGADPKRFSNAMNLLAIVAAACVMAAGVRASLAAASWQPNPELASDNYFSVLDAKQRTLQNQVTQSAGTDAGELRDCALVQWQTGKLDVAERYLRKLWSDKSNAPSSKYDPEFVQDCLYLADLYADRGSFQSAGDAYARILTYDVDHLGLSDPRVGRDFNNIGLCYFLAGETSPNPLARKECFDKAQEQYAKSEAIFRAAPQCKPQLIYNLQNQSIDFDELGENAKAKELNREVEKQLSQWHGEKS
jgi:tetratricopeptide (TPR) repeat protein